jgi:hypothetical protein
LNNLVSLDLVWNSLSTLPSSIWNLDKLRTLTLNQNNLSSLPKEFFKLMELDSLDLSDNNLDLDDFWVMYWTFEKNWLYYSYSAESLTKLRWLDLRNNPQLWSLQAVYNSQWQWNILNISWDEMEIRYDWWFVSIRWDKYPD